MGQKVNPISFRLQVSKDWNSRWFAGKKDFAKWLAEDGKIRTLIEKNGPKMSVSQGALVSIDGSGAVRAMVGGYDYANS